LIFTTRNLTPAADQVKTADYPSASSGPRTCRDGADEAEGAEGDFRMRNDEFRMTKECLMTNSYVEHCRFIRAWSFLRHSGERGRHARWFTRLAGPLLAHTGTFWRGAKKRSPRRPLLGHLVKTMDYADGAGRIEEISGISVQSVVQLLDLQGLTTRQFPELPA
jgi:hypothetical protein